ncbi:hypothetical protein KC19_9G048100 [Ceratodon purpureus]|uniref:Uncharacterized protein n=1 Tax=Ceratodon purpureus TaxID=3225 RepID=A0A8T0GSA4_CERPU|nr:hypothetical protein KC19_9G048100 [Ceratodon purpureus]
MVMLPKPCLTLLAVSQFRWLWQDTRTSVSISVTRTELWSMNVWHRLRHIKNCPTMCLRRNGSSWIHFDGCPFLRPLLPHCGKEKPAGCS